MSVAASLREGVAPLVDLIYPPRCPLCGALLEVSHDLEALRTVPADEWKRRFESRFGSSRLPQASGVWGKHEWVCPELPVGDIVSLGEGRVPLMPLPRMAAELGLASLELKECGVSPTGLSFGASNCRRSSSRSRHQAIPSQSGWRISRGRVPGLILTITGSP